MHIASICQHQIVTSGFVRADDLTDALAAEGAAPARTPRSGPVRGNAERPAAVAISGGEVSVPLGVH